MGYIDHWELISCDLVLPPAAVAGLHREPKISLKTGMVTIHLDAEDSYLSGMVKGGDGSVVLGSLTLCIDYVACWGEGSRYAYQEQLIPILKQSSGTLHAVLMLEGGNGATVLRATDGILTTAYLSMAEVADALDLWAGREGRFRTVADE